MITCQNMSTFKVFSSVIRFIILSIALISCNKLNDHDKPSVKFAIVVFRHGERTPTSLYPNDPHKNFTWTDGFGALTQKGAQQAHKIGQKTRKRYKHILQSEEFHLQHDVHVMSSSVKRCVKTAQNFVMGFLEINDLHELPIAIHPIPMKKDKLISQRAYCPKYDEMFEQMYANPTGDLKQFIENNTELFAYISKHTGKKVTSLHRGEQLYDILFIEQCHGLELPKWTDKVYPDQLLALVERNMAILTENQFMKRVKGGYLITDVLDKMIQKRNNQLNRKIFIYSGHDTTLINVMRALGITSQTTQKPDFASSLYFELHHNQQLKDDLEVKIFHSANAESDLKLIKIPNCGSPCSLTKFNNAVESMIIRDYDQTCAGE